MLSQVGTEIVKSPDGHEYDFGIITVPGGRYEVCWCIGIEPYVGCALSTHFGVRVAELLLQGPSGGAIYKCVRGALTFLIFTCFSPPGLAFRQICTTDSECFWGTA